MDGRKQPEYDTYIVEDKVEYATLVNDGHATKMVALSLVLYG